LLCCTFGSGSLLDDKDGSRGGDRSDSEPQTERVLDRPSNRGDMGATTTSDLTAPHHSTPSASDILSPDPGASSSADGSIPLQPMAVSFFHHSSRSLPTPNYASCWLFVLFLSGFSFYRPTKSPYYHHYLKSTKIRNVWY
jgi:hypothetical protein